MILRLSYLPTAFSVISPLNCKLREVTEVIYFVASEYLLLIESEPVCLGCGVSPALTCSLATFSMCGGPRGTRGPARVWGLNLRQHSMQGQDVVLLLKLRGGPCL